MYRVDVVEHFEDWYVTDLVAIDFVTIDAAVSGFLQQCKDLAEQKFSGVGIDQFISECFVQGAMTDEAIENASKGFMVQLCNENDDTMISCHFAYDPSAHSVTESSGITVHDEMLTTQESTVLKALDVLV